MHEVVDGGDRCDGIEYPDGWWRVRGHLFPHLDFIEERTEQERKPVLAAFDQAMLLTDACFREEP